MRAGAAAGKDSGARAKPSPRAAFKKTFRALRNRNYRLFWFGQVISAVGTWMQRIAVAWLVLKMTNSPFDLGLVTTFQTLPVLLLALFGGVIADRVPKRKLLLVTQSTLTFQASALALLTATHHENLIAIFALAAIQGIATAIDNPTRQAFVKELVGPDDVANAVALNSIVFNTARLVGPAIGGLTIAAVGVSGCFAGNAVSFFAVLGGLLLMRPALFYDIPSPPKGKVLTQIREGLSYSVRTPEIALVMLLMAIIGTFGYNFTVVLPLIADYVLHTGPVGFGTLTSAMAVGSLAAALGIAYTGRITRRTLLAGATGFSLLLLFLSISSIWIPTIGILVLLGLFSIVFTATANSRLQMLTPPHLRGRVMSLYTLLFQGSTPIGSLVVGTLASREGVRPAVFELALLCGVGTLAGFAYARRHRSADGDQLPAVAQPAEPVRPVRAVHQAD